jgi:hypothetical protein
LESRDNWNTRHVREGVHCHGPQTAEKAERYMVFEHVFSDGAWWGTKFELLVDRECGKKVGDQWVQKADSVQIADRAPGYACARQCSPGYARDLVARIRLHAAKNSTVFRQWPVFL